MKRSIISQYEQLKGRLSGYAAMLNYRYMNLCIKAEEASLVPVSVIVEGAAKNLEDVADVAKDGEYAFKVFPKYEEDIIIVGKGIAMAHPEFKQERQSLAVEMDDGQTVDVQYLQITMPKVDDDRYDALKQATNGMYEECKVQMESAKAQVEAKIALLATDEKPEDLDKLKATIKELNKTWTEKRDQLHESKLKEIEEAHEKYLKEQVEIEEQRQEKELAAGDGGQQIDLSQLQG